MKKHTTKEADDMGLHMIRWAIGFAVALVLIYSAGVAFMVLSGLRPLDKDSSEFIFFLLGCCVWIVAASFLARASVTLIGYIGLWVADKRGKS